MNGPLETAVAIASDALKHTIDVQEGFIVYEDGRVARVHFLMPDEPINEGSTSESETK